MSVVCIIAKAKNKQKKTKFSNAPSPMRHHRRRRVMPPFLLLFLLRLWAIQTSILHAGNAHAAVPITLKAIANATISDLAFSQ